MSNRWATHGHATRHYLQLLDEGYTHQSSFINLNFTHGVAREVAKPQHAMAPQIKQGQLTKTNNPQYATKNESLQLQVTKCPIYG